MSDYQIFGGRWIPYNLYMGSTFENRGILIALKPPDLWFIIMESRMAMGIVRAVIGGCFWILTWKGLGAQPLVYPPATGNAWPTVTPIQLGWCPTGLDSLIAFAQRENTKALLVLHNGHMVIEEYFGTFTSDSAWYWASAGKALTASLVGQAWALGQLDTAAPSRTYLGAGWSSLSPAQETAIRVRHHLTMTTGLNDGVSNPDCTLPACLQYLAPSGSRWAYHNAPYTVLDALLQGATGQSPNGLMQSRIRPTTGIQGAYLPMGDNLVFWSKPRSMARFGLLIQGHGKWNGTPVVDSSWVHEMTHPSQGLNPAYGFLWWLNGQSTYRLPQSQLVFNGPLFPDAPSDVFAALGKNGQILFVAPSLGLVVVRMGQSPSSVPVPFLMANELWKRVNRLLCLAQEEESARLDPLMVHWEGGAPRVQIRPYGDLHITDVFGQEIMRLSANENGWADLPSLPTGWWTLRTDEGQWGRYGCFR